MRSRRHHVEPITDNAFTCPECGAKSFHPDDISTGYCSRCHAFTADLHSWLRAVRVEYEAGHLSDGEYADEIAFYRSRYLGQG